MRIFRVNDGISFQLQRADECGTEFRKKMERSSKKSNVAADRFPAGKPRDRLVHNSLEDGCRQIFPGSALIDQRLDIGLRKDTASSGNWIDRLIIFRILIQTSGICLQKICHLVNKRSCAAGTDTVHALFKSVGEINDLGIFTAKFDRNICGWSNLF